MVWKLDKSVCKKVNLMMILYRIEHEEISGVFDKLVVLDKYTNYEHPTTCIENAMEYICRAEPGDTIVLCYFDLYGNEERMKVLVDENGIGKWKKD